jgi:hypothetical protein
MWYAQSLSSELGDDGDRDEKGGAAGHKRLVSTTDEVMR